MRNTIPLMIYVQETEEIVVKKNRKANKIILIHYFMI